MKKEINDFIDSCMHEVELKAKGQEKLQKTFEDARKQFDDKKEEVDRLNSLVALAAKKTTITSLKDRIINQMEKIINQKEPTSKPVKKKIVRPLEREVIFNQVHLSTPEDVDRYLLSIKNRLLSYINDDEEIQIK